MEIGQFTQKEKEAIQNCFDEKVKKEILETVNEGVDNVHGKSYGVTLYFDPNYRWIKIITTCDINDRDTSNVAVLDQRMKDKAELILGKIKKIFAENEILYKGCTYCALYYNPIILDFFFQ